MKKEIKKYEIQCDCCSTRLTKRTSYINDSSYQADYLTLGDIDLCHYCAAVIFDINVIYKIPEDKMLGWIKDAQKRLNNVISFRLKIQSSSNMVADTSKTDGYNEITQATCLNNDALSDKNLSVLDTNSSPVQNLGDL